MTMLQRISTDKLSFRCFFVKLSINQYASRIRR